MMPEGLTPEEQYLWRVMQRAETVEECKLAVSSHLYEMARRSRKAKAYTTEACQVGGLRLVRQNTDDKTAIA